MSIIDNHHNYQQNQNPFHIKKKSDLISQLILHINIPLEIEEEGLNKIRI